MITDTAVERVEFRCPESHWQSVVDYDVVTYADADARRLIPVPPGDDRRPRQRVFNREAHRAQRRNGPLLPGTSTRSDEISRPAGAEAGTATRRQPGAP